LKWPKLVFLTANWVINLMLKEGVMVALLVLMLSTETAPNRIFGLLMRITVSENVTMIAVWNNTKAAMYTKHFALFRFPSPF
ncbi:Late embryogenesis abundant protein, partial [Actinidia chinensis var. chinensis]